MSVVTSSECMTAAVVVFAFHFQPRVLAAVYARCDQSIDDHGSNKDLSWAPNGDRLAVLVSMLRS